MKKRDRIIELLTAVRYTTNDIEKVADEICLLFSVVGRSEQFNCLGGNYAKGIKSCEEWCGEDICQKQSN